MTPPNTETEAKTETEFDLKDVTVARASRIEVPERIVAAIAGRLEHTDDPSSQDVIDLAHDHVETDTKHVVPDGRSLEEAVLDSVSSETEADDATLEYDEELETETEPVGVEATAELDYAAEPERPLSIELEVPAGVVDEDDLVDILDGVSIDARIAEE